MVLSYVSELGHGIYVKKLASMAGVKRRGAPVLHSFGLLPPVARRLERLSLYGEAEVDRLQQILFYVAGCPARDIRKILSAPDYDDTRPWSTIWRP
jgi:DNA-binding transcriptional MerR regulator